MSETSELKTHVKAGRQWNITQMVVLAALGASLGLNAVLLARIADAQRGPIATERIKLGTRLLPIQARTTAGESVSIASSQPKPVILYFFSTSCVWCERNWQNVLALEAMTREKYAFIGVSNSPDTGEFADTRHLPFRCLTAVDEHVLRKHHIGGTPRTIVLGSDGRVAGDWVGAYSSETRKEIEAFFGVHLPGLEGAEHKEVRPTRPDLQRN